MVTHMFFEKIKTMRIVTLAVFVLILCATFVYVCAQERKECMGVPILESTTEYTTYEYRDFSDSITHYEKPAAIDIATSTIYISQPFDSDTDYVDFKGALNLHSGTHRMYFAPDAEFADMNAAAKAGHPFRLIITDGSEKYMEYKVVFTSLPVINIKGELSYLRDNDVEGDPPVEIFAGNITVWTPYDPEVKAYTAKSSALEWHVRGNSAANHVKKPWKVALKDKKGENADLNLFGLGADDDWIVNAIAFDHTRIREKLFIGLWNDMAAETGYNSRMTDGQYAEVVMNGEYHGLYIVQRRIDGKYLQLSEHDILAKGMRTYVAEYAYKAYKIIHTNLDEDYVYLLLDNFFSRTDMSSFNVDNFIDCNLFIQFSFARDNRLFNNNYFTLKASPDGYKTTITMWDTDISFGKYGVSRLDFDGTVYAPMEREDTDSIRALHPDYDQKAYERWCQLRKNILTEEYIYDKMDTLMDEITLTGSLARDYEKWGVAEDDEDNLETVKRFVAERLPWADEYLAEKAGAHTS